MRAVCAVPRESAVCKGRREPSFNTMVSNYARTSRFGVRFPDSKEAKRRPNGTPPISATCPFHAEVRIARQVSHPNVCRVYGLYGRTLKGTLLESVRLGITTWTFPVVAPAGTVVVIKYLDATVNVAAVPLKVTLVAPVRSLPRILTDAPV